MCLLLLRCFRIGSGVDYLCKSTLDWIQSLSIFKPFELKVFVKLNEKQPVVLSKQPIVLLLGVLKKVENSFWWLTCCQTKTIDWFALSTDCLFSNHTENYFVCWLSFKWFCNWMRSCFKCFDQSLKAIKSFFRFCNKQELRFNHRKTYLSFSLILLSRVKDCFEIALIKREWNMIFICIDFRSFCNKCNQLTLCKLWCDRPRSVVCSWGCQDQHSWWCLCWDKGSVCLEGITVTSLVVCVSNLGLVT